MARFPRSPSLSLIPFPSPPPLPPRSSSSASRLPPPSGPMPARTLPTSPTISSPPRYYHRPAPSSSQLQRESRNSQDERSRDFSTYAPFMPHNPRPDGDPAPSVWSQSRVYPDPSSIPPHWQIHPATLTHFRDGRAYIVPASLAQSNSRVPWQTPYSRAAQPIVAPPPPPIPHKVWILDCRACGTFLTNRGMKAVLLLRPNVPLYSTDALPTNCSAYSPESELSMYGASISTSSNTSSGTVQSPRSSISGPSGDSTQLNGSSDNPPTRTCDCLTQTLCCHGCGNAVGYIIVAPCQRCTSSITVNNRATNGHRFVFYSSEITACERHYVFRERGVSPYHPIPPSSAQGLHASLAGLTIGGTPVRTTLTQQSPTSPTVSTPASMPPLSPVSPSAGRTSMEYLPTPPSEVDGPLLGTISTQPTATATARTSISASSSRGEPAYNAFMDDAGQAVPPVPPNSHATSPTPPTSWSFFADASNRTHNPYSTLPARTRAASVSAAGVGPSLPSNLVNGSIYVPRQPPMPTPVPLKAGEILYWHHLLRSGEIPAVHEDPRARVGLPSGDEKAGGGRCYKTPSGIVAGR